MRLALIVTAAFFQVACMVGNDASSLYIVGHVAPAADDCSLDVSNARVARGAINVDYRSSYTLFPVYNSTIIENSSTAPLRSDPNGLHIQGAVVQLLQPDANAPDGFSLIDFGASRPNPFRVVTADYIPSAGGLGSAAATVGTVEVMPPSYVQYFRDNVSSDLTLVIASVKAFGTTLGGTDVESDEWQWPIDVGRGKFLFACPEQEGRPDPACLIGQDVISRMETLGAKDLGLGCIYDD